MKKILVIVGPTAVGKTALSIDLAKKFNGEIISGDSMQVYKRLDIGTAKITEAEMESIPHHLIDIKEVGERYSAADFVSDASELIDKIISKDKLPIVVGGTGFYLQALLEGLSLGGDQYVDQAVRDKWQIMTEKNGNQWLHEELAKIDPVSAENIPVNNVRRMIRAIEVYENTGSLFSNQVNQLPSYDAMIIGLDTDRELLYKRINQRVETMMEKGLLNELDYLNSMGGFILPASKGIGYREFEPYFEGNATIEEVVEEIKKDSRHYAKRQLTWFRNKTKPNWYNLVQSINSISEIENDVKKWLNNR